MCLFFFYLTVSVRPIMVRFSIHVCERFLRLELLFLCVSARCPTERLSLYTWKASDETSAQQPGVRC